ncbi:hypothetical protein M427DRAFT_29070 [Gonapodya prolifera JEL478]|uniref:Uncharacterized protein n=1 Tax=Gonapodya prolifera (strain JEL478) TaxID=1344416 RepID=A0A139ARC1_GONPJ|nr:hypothetical protein M427DRAFT_29070 [Gonapodya prolifera JEL478]|eukprot:KXS19073.1 hypothetical protein M427DRAFT_29070 [Gonapodya prolifera JEL478]
MAVRISLRLQPLAVLERRIPKVEESLAKLEKDQGAGAVKEEVVARLEDAGLERGQGSGASTEAEMYSGVTAGQDQRGSDHQGHVEEREEPSPSETIVIENAFFRLPVRNTRSVVAYHGD